MQNNIKIRNLYIGKVQKQINKLMYSVNLLNNLNNVIDNQYGGANTSMPFDQSNSNIDQAKELLAQQNVTHDYITLSPVSTAVDKTTDDLKATVDILKKFIEKLKKELQLAINPKEKEELNKKITDLNSQVSQLTNDLENKTKEMVELNDKMKNFEKMLIEYNRILDELKKKLPQIKNNQIEQFNSVIDKLITTLIDPNNIIQNFGKIKSQKIQIKIKSKFEDVFKNITSNEINKLKEEATQLKITNGPIVKNVQINIQPHLAKNQEESTAIHDHVIKYNANYKKFMEENEKIIKNLTDFQSYYNRVDFIMGIQQETGELNFTDFNDYFNIKEEDLKN